LNTLFFLDIRALSEHLFLKIIGKFAFHKSILPALQMKNHRNFRIFCFFTEAEVDYTIEKMPPLINKLRRLSPFVSKQLQNFTLAYTGLYRKKKNENFFQNKNSKITQPNPDCVSDRPIRLYHFIKVIFAFCRFCIIF